MKRRIFNPGLRDHINIIVRIPAYTERTILFMYITQKRFMARLLTLEDLQRQIERARDRLSRDRAILMALAPLPGDFCRDAYGFSYLRAERLCMDAIAERLEEISWLPVHLDPQAEVLPESKQTIKKWLSSSPEKQPSSEAFGNDFVHALARTALVNGWQSPDFKSALGRVGDLFHDLSCVIGLIYYGIWMTENGFGGVAISDPRDLERTARELAALSRSPEIVQYLYQRQKLLAAERKKEKHKKGAPTLHIVKDTRPPDGPFPPA